jgi:integrase
VDDVGSISWESGNEPDTFFLSPASSKSFDAFLRYCKTKAPNIPLSDSCKIIEEQKNRLRDVHKNVIENISKEPLLASFIVWVKTNPELLEGAKVLLEHGFIGIVDNKGEVWSIQKARGFDQKKIIEVIRCRRALPIATRESLVKTYISFIQWLSGITYGYINKLEDSDLLRSAGRVITHQQFIQFLDALANEKAQLVAKLLYFGGKRTLEEVLSIDLKQVDFKKRQIQFDSEFIEYPEHVFNDIKALTEDRKTGYVFEGKQKSLLNPRTIFRNFHDAASSVGFGASFGIKRLTMSE